MVGQAETLAQRRRQHAGASGRADEGETLDRNLVGLRVRAAIHHDVDPKIFHRRIQKLFDDAAEPVDLIDKEHVACLQRR